MIVVGVQISFVPPRLRRTLLGQAYDSSSGRAIFVYKDRR
jgi:hypothetical protein